MNIYYRFFLIAVLLSGLMMGGCASVLPQERYANATAVNASLIRSKLVTFSKGSEKFSQQRVASIGVLAQSVDSLENELEVDFTAMRLVTPECVPPKGQKTCQDRSKLGILENIMTLSESVVALDEEAQKRNEDLRQQILTTQKQLGVPTKELTAVEKNLAKLGKARSFIEEAVFLSEFGKEVKKNLDQAQTMAQDSEEEGNEKLDATARDLKTIASVLSNDQADKELQP